MTDKSNGTSEREAPKSAMSAVGCLKGCASVVFLVVLIAIPLRTRRDFRVPAEPDFSTGYVIEEVDDMSDEKTVRYVYLIRMLRPFTAAEGMAIARERVDGLGSEVNAVGFSFYYPESGLGGYEHGVINYAPYGDWSRASEINTGDYSNHEWTVVKWLLTDESE